MMLNFRRTLVAAFVTGAAAIDGGVDKPGLNAAFSEEGYKKVAATKNDDEMKTYIKRMLQNLHREVADEGQLNGFTRFYSGTEAVQSYARLAEELENVPWSKEATQVPAAVVAKSTMLASAVPEQPARTNLRAGHKANVSTLANLMVGGNKTNAQAVKVSAHNNTAMQTKRAGAALHVEKNPASAKQDTHKDQQHRAAPKAPVSATTMPPTVKASLQRKETNIQKPVHKNTKTSKHPPVMLVAATKTQNVTTVVANSSVQPAVAQNTTTFTQPPVMLVAATEAQNTTTFKQPPVMLVAATEAQNASTAVAANSSVKPAVAKVAATAPAPASLAVAMPAPVAATPASPAAPVNASQSPASLASVAKTPESAVVSATTPPTSVPIATQEVPATPVIVAAAANAAQTQLKEVLKPKLNYSMIAGALKGMELPEVDSVLHKASSTLEDFAEQAKLMQSRVAKQQVASRAALATQKQKYEAKLVAEVRRNNQTKAGNSALFAKNEQLRADNKASENIADQLQKSSNIMRDALDKLGGKMDVAMAFIADSVNITDDHDAEDLAVLRPTTPAPSLDYFLGLARAELGLQANGTQPQDAPVLLQLAQATSKGNFETLPSIESEESSADAAERRMKEGKATAEDLVPLLSRSLSKISRAEAAGIAAMKEKFDLKHEANDRRYAELLQVQKELEDEGAILLEKKVALREANAKLSDTRESLFQRLHGFQVFALKVDEAMAETLRAADDMMS